ncbi:hypothetical protein LBMAG27_03860 [Bacteroidota bacterium]|nr:hypothetical protein LBMAG27_03860 [Bacteroidota bacterium]
MENSKYLASDIKNFIADLRAEVVAAELIEKGNYKGIKILQLVKIKFNK